ncbi:MAG: choice-of-anchor R domain-containing protein [bacterium]|nr:choice-of-anchor R domain-containing protein [bacterium]
MKIITNTKGQTLFAVIVFLSIVMVLSISMFVFVMNTRKTSNIIYYEQLSRNIAEAGIEKAVWCLNNEDICGEAYTGENTNFGDGQYSTTVSSMGGDYIVNSTGTINGKSKSLRVTIGQVTTSIDASFFYGVQVGSGGLKMEENSHIEGNVYSNGSIDGDNNTIISGDAYVAGSTNIVPDQIQDQVTDELIFGKTADTMDIAQSFKAGVTEVINYVSFKIKRFGNVTDQTVYITNDDGGQPADTYIATGTLQASQVTGTLEWVNVSFTTNPELTQNTTYWIVVNIDSPKDNKYYTIGKNDNFGYGNGVGLYSTDWSSGIWGDAGGDLAFKTWMGSGSTDTFIEGVIVGDDQHTCDDTHYATHHGDVHAHSILNTEVECDAYYSTDITGSTIGRNPHSGSVDPPPENMPISVGQINEWKNNADVGTPITGNYTTGTAESLGPKKIDGDLTVPIGSTLTITGTIWVTGNIFVENGATVQLHPDYGSTSDVVLNDGIMDIENGSTFNGSGDDQSFILMLTTNTSIDPNLPAITIANNTEAVIFYAANGMIYMANNANLKEATGYQLRLAQNAYIVYEQGLANASFSNGPGGVWATLDSTWQEID